MNKIRGRAAPHSRRDLGDLFTIFNRRVLLMAVATRCMHRADLFPKFNSGKTLWPLFASAKWAKLRSTTFYPTLVDLLTFISMYMLQITEQMTSLEVRDRHLHINMEPSYWSHSMALAPVKLRTRRLTTLPMVLSEAEYMLHTHRKADNKDWHRFWSAVFDGHVVHTAVDLRPLAWEHKVRRDWDTYYFNRSRFRPTPFVRLRDDLMRR